MKWDTPFHTIFDLYGNILFPYYNIIFPPDYNKFQSVWETKPIWDLILDPIL